MSTRSILVAFFLVLGALSVLVGCRAEECRQMTQCCNEIQGQEGVGGACGEMAEGVKDPDTCRTVLRTVRAMFEENDEPVPEVCQ